MTDDQADELLRNNDWSKWSDARELLMEAAHIGAMDERKNLDAELRRLAEVEAQRDALLEALERIAQLSMSQFHIPYDMAAEACNIASAAIKQAEGENT